MGAKTAILAYSDGSTAAILRTVPEHDPGRTADLVTLARPGHVSAGPADPGTPAWSLDGAVYPPAGSLAVLAVPGLDLICDRGLMVDKPSDLAERFVAASRGRRLYFHGMHSVVDWLAFAIWEDGALVRSLSLSPDDGILEDVGERLPFELPYWAGRYPVDDEDEDEEPYPLPFHPLELGEDALTAFFGFSLAGRRGDQEGDGGTTDVVDPRAVHVPVLATRPAPAG